MTQEYSPDSYAGKLNNLFSSSIVKRNSPTTSTTISTTNTPFDLTISEENNQSFTTTWDAFTTANSEYNSASVISSTLSASTSALSISTTSSTLTVQDYDVNIPSTATSIATLLFNLSTSITAVEDGYELNDSTTSSISTILPTTTNLITTIKLPARLDPINNNTDGQLIYAVFLSLITIIGILGNSTVIYILFKDLTLHIRTHFTNITFLSLSLTGLGTCIFVCFPGVISVTTGYDPSHNGFICRFQCMASFLCTAAALGTIAVISIDRFLAVRWPLHYHKWVTRNRFAFAIAFVWIQAFLASIYTIANNNLHIRYDYWNVTCDINWTTSVDAIAFGSFSLVWFVILPALIILCFNVIILRLVWLEKNKIKSPALHRQQAIRGVQVIPTSTSTTSNNPVFMNRFSGNTNPVFMEPPAPTPAWGNIKPRFHPRTDVSMVSTGEEQIFRRISPPASLISRDTSNYAVLQCYIAVTLAYLGFHLPLAITFFVKIASEKVDYAPGGIIFLATVTQFLASVINPFLYGIFRKDFRMAYSQLFATISRLRWDRNWVE